MNYLAHAYLSFQQPEILVGNMISDFVKGKKRYDFPAGIQQGIMLHREIDQFTDAHPAVKAAREVFRPAYRLYGAALIDVVLDHFLAVDEHEFAGERLVCFTAQTYESLNRYEKWFPERFRQLFIFMKTQNWLLNYQFPWGIEKALYGVIQRARYLNDSTTAYRLFMEHYTRLQSCYRQFFPDVKNLAFTFLNKNGY
jgi:acyl carrier protein phosphodiesterase